MTCNFFFRDMDHQERVKALTDSELRQELMAVGEAVGPITSTTRPLFERKLLRCLMGDEAHTTEPQPPADGKKTNSSTEPEDKDKNENDRDITKATQFFGVAVPSGITDVSHKQGIDIAAIATIGVSSCCKA